MLRLSKNINFSNYTLIIPSVAVGNVGQLTCDLIISTLNLDKIGTIFHKAIIPVYGSNPFDPESTDNCQACELYINESEKIAVIQLRSSVEPKLITVFLQDFKSLIQAQNFQQICIITSSFAYELHNINKGYYRYVTNTDLSTILEELNVRALELEDDGKINLHGAGFATQLYEIFKSDMKVLMIIKYASEGDNRPDAIQMYSILQKCLSIKNQTDITYPYSWDLIYGNPPPTGLY